MQRVNAKLIRTLFWCAAMAPAAAGQDYGIEFKTVGSPGNAAASVEDFPLLAVEGLGPTGRVDYTYRMAKTELTVSQYFEFVQAYSPLNPGVAYKSGFFGTYIHNTSGDALNPTWEMDGDAANFPMDMSWEFAARYCNWLGNGKVNQSWAFETGAYDTSTFKIGPSGEWEGQAVHTPGAKFWISSVDEWTKAMHFDPDKYGPGQAGYWLYPAKSDTPLIAGPPGSPGAQTPVGDFPGKDNYLYLPVGSYPDAQSPWGLLDGSGGNPEWLEHSLATGSIRFVRGTSSWQTFSYFDRLDKFTGGSYWAPGNGLRISSSDVPSSSAAALIVFTTTWVSRRKRDYYDK